MEVACNGKIIGNFLDFADNGDSVLVGTKKGTKKLSAFKCVIVCDTERRHGGTEKTRIPLYNVGVSN